MSYDFGNICSGGDLFFSIMVSERRDIMRNETFSEQKHLMIYVLGIVFVDKLI